MSTPVLVFESVSKTYDLQSDRPRPVLRGVDLTLPPGRVAALVGPSGSGKSTLLHLAAGIDVPSAGRVLLEGKDLASLSDHERTLLRRDAIGIVFQFFHLLPHLSVEENVRLPDWIAGERGGRSPDRVQELLERVGLRDRARDAVDRLSGGEMQRVALCRALLRRPRLLLADEPTGNLDEENGLRVLELLLGLVRRESTALILATHSPELAARADVVWRLGGGTLVSP